MSLKSRLVSVLGPANIRRINTLLGRQRIEEVNLVFAVFDQSGKRGTMIDVGAHHGSTIADFAKNGWRILAFEPDNANRAVLERNFGNQANVTILREAVLDNPRQGLEFFASDVSTGISGLSAFHSSHRPTQTVDATTIADAMQAHAIEHVDFLKIDTEGHDLFVLRGVDWQRPPDVIVCEFEDRKTAPLGYRLPDLVGYLREQGYRVTISEWYPVVEYGRRHKWRRFTADETSVAPDGWGNLVAFRDTEQFQALGVDRIANFCRANP